jgi:hypothetical protein
VRLKKPRSARGRVRQRNSSSAKCSTAVAKFVHDHRWDEAANLTRACSAPAKHVTDDLVHVRKTLILIFVSVSGVLVLFFFVLLQRAFITIRVPRALVSITVTWVSIPVSWRVAAPWPSCILFFEACRESEHAQNN